MGRGYSNPESAPNTVNTGAITDDAVTEPKIAANAVTASEIAAGAVGTSEIADNTVAVGDLATDSVDHDEIAADAVRAAEIQAGAVGTSEIADGTVSATDLGTDSVAADEIAAGAVGSSELAAGAALTNIGTGNITATQLGAGSVDESEIATDAVRADEIQAGAVGTSEIADGTVSATDLAAGSITAADAAADMATQAELDAVVAGAVTDGSIKASKIDGVQVLTATGSISSADGSLVTFSGASGQTLTMPAATVGLAFEIRNVDTTDKVTIARAGSDVFGAAETSIVLGPGQSVRLVCAAAGAWTIIRDAGQQVCDGYAQATTDSSGAGDKLSMTIIGDGVTPIRVDAQMHAELTAAASQQVYARIRDGAGGTGNMYGQEIGENAVSGEEHALSPWGVIPPFTGSKTLYLNMVASSGTPAAMEGTRGATRTLRATWAPGHYTANP